MEVRHTIVVHSVEASSREDCSLAGAEILFNNTSTILLDHHGMCCASNGDDDIVLAMFMGWEHRARAEIELRDCHAHALQSGPSGLVGVADRTWVAAILPLWIGGEVIFPLVAARAGQNVIAIEHSRRE